jgi:plasmid stability protein
MAGVATLNIRNVPAEVVETLKARAARKGDSLNTEVVRALEQAAGRRTVDEILERIDAIRRDHPAPPCDEFMEAVHREEDERAEHIWREAMRPRVEE